MFDQRPDYELCPTYPGVLILPFAMSEEEIGEAAAYRSKGRLPTVSFREPTTGAVLTRSSQPLAGVSKKRCTADEKLCNLYRTKGRELTDEESKSDGTIFAIMDCRGVMAATGNQVQGRGVEDTSHYERATLEYLNIGNIHTMRGSLEKLVDLCRPSAEEIRVDAAHITTQPTPTTRSNSSSRSPPVSASSSALDARPNSTSAAAKRAHKAKGWLGTLEETGWLSHVRLVMIGSLKTASHLIRGTSVLLHCSVRL